MLRSILTGSSVLLMSTALAGMAHADNTYGPFPVTVDGYKGDKTNSVSYSGQVARHVLSDSLKKLAGKGDGGSNAKDLHAQMLLYFEGSKDDLPVVSHKGKDGFAVKQASLNKISKGKNMSGKFYDGAMPAWPGGMTGKQAVLHMIKQASMAKGGFDPNTGYDYPQLISKFALGAMSYNQAVDNYLDEKLRADKKPNNKPYKKGAHYTGKEHSWDEAFGYFGAAAHSLSLSAGDNIKVAKMKDISISDANKDGVVDLKSEMVFGNAYYAASFDKSGKTEYMPTIVNAFLDGRKLITSAKGKALTDKQRAQLQAYAATIATNWEKVLAEAVFKYAGSVYKDIKAITSAKNDADKAKAYRKYGKHWGELKGFSMALQSGKSNLGKTAVELNKLIGYGPPTLDNTYVTGVSADGNFKKDRRRSWSDYQLHMLKVQKLMVDAFGVKARVNDATGDLAKLAKEMDKDMNAETD